MDSIESKVICTCGDVNTVNHEDKHSQVDTRDIPILWKPLFSIFRV